MDNKEAIQNAINYPIIMSIGSRVYLMNSINPIDQLFRCGFPILWPWLCPDGK